MVLVDGVLFIGGSDVGNDKSLVDINTTADMIHNFQSYRSFLDSEVW